MHAGILIATVSFKSSEQYDYVCSEKHGYIYFNDMSFYRCKITGSDPQKKHMKAWCACPELISNILITPFDPASFAPIIASFQNQLNNLSIDIDNIYDALNSLDSRVSDLESK